jgi:hypothetical protein
MAPAQPISPQMQALSESIASEGCQDDHSGTGDL